jgi:hypothetical protein
MCQRRVYRVCSILPGILFVILPGDYEQPVMKQNLQVIRGTLSRTLQRTVVL